MELDEYRVELTGYCYRMLGSPFEAEDAVQETLMRAWRSFDRFDERRGRLRTWLYSIATNVCIDMLRSAQRRARAMDLAPASYAGAPLGTALPEARWVLPVPDGRVIPAGDPAEIAVARETIRLAFVAALQRLTPRQRSVLILRDVLCFEVREIVQLLGTTTASVNSALQRARATIEAGGKRPAAPADERLVARYVDAFQRDDVETLVSLLSEDASMSMPPFLWWLRGRSEIERALVASGGPCRGARLVRTAASGTAAFWQYRPGDDGHLALFGLVTVETAGGQVTEIATHLHIPERLLALFDAPMILEDPDRSTGS